jgi:hypothetical protein
MYKYKKNGSLRRIKKELYINRLNFAYYYHKELHHALRWYVDFAKNWAYKIYG